MEQWQQIFVGLVGIVSALIWMVGIRKSSSGKSFEETPGLLPWGIFVWGDAFVIGGFWVLATIVCLIVKDWFLFWLIVAGFWLIRSGGETIYWICQQFSPINRNPPEKLRGYNLFKNDSIWFGYQVFWQCVMVVSLVVLIWIVNR